MKAVKLSNSGELYVYSIVHRSFPGIEVPYVSRSSTSTAAAR
jgi:uncharacterized protein